MRLFIISCTASILNVEKVVNAPKKPVAMMMPAEGLSRPRPVNMPRPKEPSRLTAAIPSGIGKPFVLSEIVLPKRERNTAPIPAAISIRTIVMAYHAPFPLREGQYAVPRKCRRMQGQCQRLISRQHNKKPLRETIAAEKWFLLRRLTSS